MIPSKEQLEFDAVWLASRPPEVQRAYDLPDNERIPLIEQLAYKYKIFTEIDAMGFSAYVTMRLLMLQGYTWFPSALQDPQKIAPGLDEPGVVPYDPLHPPAGCWILTLDPAAYPPWFKPEPATPPPTAASPVGFQLVGRDNAYGDRSGNKYHDGALTGENGVPSDPRGQFILEVIQTPFGPSDLWHKMPWAKMA